MAYSVDNPPALQYQGVAGFGKTWVYNSTDPATDVRADGYITNAKELGLSVGDVVHQRDKTGATVAHDYTVLAINADGSANLSDGTATPDLTDT